MRDCCLVCYVLVGDVGHIVVCSWGWILAGLLIMLNFGCWDGWYGGKWLVVMIGSIDLRCWMWMNINMRMRMRMRICVNINICIIFILAYLDCFSMGLTLLILYLLIPTHGDICMHYGYWDSVIGICWDTTTLEGFLSVYFSEIDVDGFVYTYIWVY